jgi:hypothetical protein
VYSADAAGIPKKAISTVARFLESDLPTTSVFTDQASTYTAGKQTFVASSSSSAGVNIPTGSDPTTPAQGDIWLNSDTLKYRGTSTHSLITSAITSINSDTNAAQTIQGVSGNTSASTSAGTTTINTGSNVVVTGGSAQTISKQLTINSGVLGGNLNVGSNALSNSGHLITIPTNTGTVLLTNGSGSSLTNIVTSITGTANNLTSSASTGAVTLNLGSNVVTTGGSAQTITKALTLTSPKVNGLNTNFTKITASPKTLDYNADTIVVDATSANPTIINLPTAAGHQGKIYNFQKNDTSGNTVMIDPFGTEKINGALNLNLTSNLGSATLQSDGTNWERTDRTADEANSFRTQGATINRWYGDATSALASTTIISTANQLRAYPFIVPKAITIDKIQTEISTAGSPTSGQFCRMGIYTEDGNTYPYHLVAGSDVATFVGSAGVKTNTFTSPITLRAGLYFLVHDCESFTTTQPTFRGVPVGAVPSVLGYVSTMGANGMGTAWQVAFTETGGTALPSIYPTGGTVQNNLIQAMILVRIIG